MVEGIDNCLVKLSRCCNPLPGDEVIGFITRGHGVSVHKRDCPNVPVNLEEAAEPDRWIPVHWDKNVKEQFNATLRIYCINKIGMMADIATDLAAMHVNIQSISVQSDKSGNSNIIMTIVVSNAEHLRTVILHLNKVNGVLSVERTGL